MSYYNLISLMPKTPAVDPDAQAFITAAAITNPTQQAAINTLVVDLKGYSIWTKMKAVYPYVGGTATTHKFNLKNPLDTNAAFRILWSGDVTHSSNGVQFGGVNGYGVTNYNVSLNNTADNISAGVYLRTNSIVAAPSFSAIGSSFSGIELWAKNTDNNTYYAVNSDILSGNGNFVSDTRGMFVVSKLAVNQKVIYRNGIQLSSNIYVAANLSPNFIVHVGARNIQGVISNYDSRQHAFQYIGDTLTAAEVGNLTTAVQAFQTTLGRSIGTQTVSDADAQAFVTAANIQDQVEANAINNLVIGMKADGLWSKMKAVYPFVGGSSTSHSYNLRNTAQYQISWNGGITHNSTGVLPNGTNGYGQTGFSFNSTTALSSHISTYIRTNSTSFACEMGSGNASTGDDECRIVRNGAAWSNNQCDNVSGRLSPSAVNSTGLILNSRRANNDWETYQNGISLSTKTNTNSYTGGSNYSIALFARNSVGSYDIYSNKQCAFASIGDGLTDTDATNLNTRVTTFQTALNRNV